MNKEEYISWNDMSEEEKAEFLSQTHLKLRNMSKAEKYIIEHTRNCSNLMQVPTLDDKGNIVPEAHSWLTPDDARKAVEIAREEVIEQTAEWLTKHAKKYYFNKERYLGTDELVEDYKLIMSMKDE